MGNHSRLRMILTLILLVIGLARTLAIVLHTPLLGYANNYDFMRVQTCFDITPTIQTTPSGMHLDMPSATYRYEQVLTQDNCLYSSALAPFQLGIWLDQLQNAIQSESFLQLKWIGLMQAILLFAAAFALSYGFWRMHPGAALLNASIYALILADPLNSLYFNTLYLEASALLYMYLACGLTLLLALRTYRPLWLWTLYALSLFLLAASKGQHMFHPLLFLLLLSAFILTARQRLSWLTLTLPLAATIAGILLHHWAAGRSESLSLIADTNLTNSYMHLLLGHAENPQRSMEILGLPPHCLVAVGKTRFDPIHVAGNVCPEIVTLSRAMMIPVLVDDPAILLRALPRTAEISQRWIYSIIGMRDTAMGMVHGAPFASPEFTFPSPHSSLGAWVMRWPNLAYSYGMLLPSFILASASGLFLLWNIARRRALSPLSFSIITLYLAGYMAFFAALFGDGLPDLGRHQHLFCSFIPAAILLTLVFFYHSTVSRYGASRFHIH